MEPWILHSIRKSKKENLRPSVWDFKLKHTWVMLQDNDPKHTSMSNSEWLKKNKIKVLEWPNQSPELNLIEMVWHHLKQSIHARKLSNVAELKQFCKGEWFFHSDVKDSLPVIANAWLQLLLQRVAQPVIRFIGNADGILHILVVTRGYLSYCCLSIISNQSAHLPLTSDNNKAFLSTQLLLTGYFLFFLSVNPRDGCAWKSQ